MIPEHKSLTTQELLISLYSEREHIGEKMKDYPLEADQSGFAKLHFRVIELEGQIKEILDSIKPISTSGGIGQDTLRGIQDPDGRKITRKKK
ncbi:hypothetical protein A2Z67_01440 [Candidatus Woesebacteria bacterium RBG_13_36_22]|uniref:Uncharacterized protein n=1 Tax=Candidatus Woesebacteria bacterium RBG_13_36_22 TaxID=1802478 RepID=A0A1F7X1Y0_9BACT|nr:MAG: hypothetical protein A2Z67_01440 [Candidatus Woesebacteria bacterium RBG_13_36_22]